MQKLGRSYRLLCALPVVLIISGHAPKSLGNEASPITPIPLEVPVNHAEAELGRKLFNDVRLSSDDSTSCASCHLLDRAGVDGLPVSKGVGGAQGSRNSPTVFNAVFNFRQFWDGRSETLQAQAVEPVVNPVEMGMANWDAVEDKLLQISEYDEQFEEVYGTKLTADLVVQAIAEFEKTLITPNAPFDQYLRGDESALSEQQKKGFDLFKSYGCSACHQGVNVGGNMFQKFGVLKDISLRRSNNKTDLGRFEVTGNEWDKNVFKVPSLRLAAHTAPYFHDGSVPTLAEAVNVMIEFQLGREVPSEDRDAIVAFIESLAGQFPE